MASKLRRLAELRYRLPHMSQGALAALCQEAAVGGLPDHVRRKGIRGARDDIAARKTPNGPLHCTIQIPRKSGRPYELELQDPMPMLCASMASSPPFANLVNDTLQMRPSSPLEPWHLILYSDEITPGNALAYDNERKSVACYYSIAEFGLALPD